jgi:hypothetical protein
MGLLSSPRLAIMKICMGFLNHTNMNKSRRTRQTEKVDGMGKIQITYSIVVRKSEDKRKI